MFTRGYCYKNYLKTGISGKVRYHTGRGSDIFEAIWGLWDLLLCLQIFKDSWDSWEPGTVLNRSVLGFSPPPLWPGIHGSWLSWNCWGMGSRSLPKSHKMKFLVLWNDWMTFKFQLECSWSLFELLRFWNRSSRFSWIWVHKTGSWFENNGESEISAALGVSSCYSSCVHSYSSFLSSRSSRCEAVVLLLVAHRAACDTRAAAAALSAVPCELETSGRVVSPGDGDEIIISLLDNMNIM